jgi:uncharacterized RDD family membrane protein YckC
MSAAPKLDQQAPQSAQPSLTLLKAHSEVGLNNFPPSSKGKRFLAALMDVFFSGLIMELLEPLLGTIGNGPVVELVALLVATIFYFVVPTALYGYTLGKKIMGLKVVGKNFGTDLGFFQVLVRETFGKWFLSIGYLWILMRNDRRGLHDILTRTRVIEFKN